MIKNFKELEAAYIAKDMDMSREEFITTLKEKEREALRSEVKTWGEDVYTVAHDELSKTGLKFPTSMIQEICLEDLDMAQEVYSKGIADTSPREILLAIILQKIGVPEWPYYSSTDKYVKRFQKKLHEQAPKFGIEFINKDATQKMDAVTDNEPTLIKPTSSAPSSKVGKPKK